MTFSSLRTVSALALAALLTACGAGQQEDQGTATMASVVVSSSVSTPEAGAAVSAAGAAAAPVASANMPAPDCAPEGCSSLRIIDGNAEAYRIDAQRRAAEEGALANS